MNLGIKWLWKDTSKESVKDLKNKVDKLAKTTAKTNTSNTFSEIQNFRNNVFILNDKNIQMGYQADDIKLTLEGVSGGGNARVFANKGELILDANTLINASNKRVKNVATPTAGTDAANKAYVDRQISNNRPPQTDLSNYYTKPEVETRIDAAKRSLQSNIDSLGDEVRPKIEKNKNDIVDNANKLNILTTEVNTFDNRISQLEQQLNNKLTVNGLSNITYITKIVNMPTTQGTSIVLANDFEVGKVITAQIWFKRSPDGPWMVIPAPTFNGNWPGTLEVAGAGGHGQLTLWRQAETSTTLWTQCKLVMLYNGQITWRRGV